MIKHYTFHKGNNHSPIRVLQLSHHFGSLRILSAVGSRSIVDSVGAMLRGRDKSCSCCDDAVAGSDAYRHTVYANDNRGRENPDKGFRTWTHLLGMDTFHLLAINKNDGVMPSRSMDHLWHLLRSDEFTTPIVRDWLPWLHAECIRCGFMVSYDGFGAADLGAQLTMKDCHLDELVSEGLKLGQIHIPERRTA